MIMTMHTFGKVKISSQVSLELIFEEKSLHFQMKVLASTKNCPGLQGRSNSSRCTAKKLSLNHPN